MIQKFDKSFEEHLLEVEIESGMDNGMESKFVAEDEPQMDSKPSDLTLKITYEPLPQFQKGSVVIFRIRAPGLASIKGSPLLANLDSVPSFTPVLTSTSRWCSS